MNFNIGDRVYYRNDHKYIGTVMEVIIYPINDIREIGAGTAVYRQQRIDYFIVWDMGGSAGIYSENSLELYIKSNGKDKYKFLFKDA